MAPNNQALQDRLAKLRAKMASVDTGGSTGFWSPPAGDSTIRILPEVGGMPFFFQEVGSHYIPGEKKSASIYCPAFTTGGTYECPICDLVAELWKGDEASKELAKQLRHDRKFWMNVVVRDPNDGGGNTGSGPFIFTPGVTIYNAIMVLLNNPSMGDITDLDYGSDLIINKKGEKLSTEYQVFPRPSRVDIPVHTDESKLNALLDKAQDLSWVMLSDNKEEDKALAGGLIVKLLPYNRMLDEYGIGPGMDLTRLSSQPQSTSSAREAIAQRRAERTAPVPQVDEVLVSPDAVDEQFRQLGQRRNRQ